MKSLIRLKVMGARLASYIPLIQFPMVGYLFIKQLGWNIPLWIVIFSLISIAIAIIDYKYVFPLEQILITEKNPVFSRMDGHIREIREVVRKKEASK